VEAAVSTLLDLSRVTNVLLRLVPDYVRARLEPSLTVTATADPPDVVASGAPRNTLSVHLHHVRETPESRAAIGGGARVPVRTAPMELALRYLVTAHHADASTGDPVPLVQHKLLGYALKTFHDHPVVDERTVIRAGEPPLLEELELLGHRFEVETLVLDPAEAAAFFAGESRVAPPAVFVEVRGVALDPERVERLAAPVLSIGDHVLTGGAPMLTRSLGELAVVPPGAAAAVVMRASPARVTLAEPPAALPLPAPSDPDPHRLILEGAALEGERTLVLRGRRVLARVPLDPVDAAAPVLAQAWRPRASPSRVEVSVHRRARERDGTERTLVPGIYEGSLQLRTTVRTSRGPSTIARTTNVVPVLIAPRVVRITALDARRLRLETDAAYLARSDALEIELSIGGEAVADLRDVVQRAADGTFPEPPPEVSAYEREADALIVWRSTTLIAPTPSEPRAVLLIVDGAACVPTWWEAP
jgi:hypothetical protein